MALPIEQITQRAEKTMTVYQHDHGDDSSAEVLWAATTDFGEQTITLDANGTSSASFTDREAVDARLAAVDEVQQVSITGGPTGGTFTLSFNGQTTSGIAYNAANATIETALEGLTTIGADNVSVAGGAFPANAKTVTFIGDLAATNVPILVANGASLTGGTSPGVTVAVVTEGFSR